MSHHPAPPTICAALSVVVPTWVSTVISSYHNDDVARALLTKLAVDASSVLSIRDPQGSSSVQILAVGPSLVHCLTEEAWRRTMLTPSRISQTSRFSNTKYLL
jgi:hypothetical protein